MNIKIRTLVGICASCFTLGSVPIHIANKVSSINADKSIQCTKNQLVATGVTPKELDVMEKRASYYSSGNEERSLWRKLFPTIQEYGIKGRYWQRQLDSLLLDQAKKEAGQNIILETMGISFDAKAKKAIDIALKELENLKIR